MWPETTGLKQTACDVVREIAEAQSGASKVFEPPVDGLRRTVAGARSVEERENVSGALLHGPAELADLDERGRDPAGE